MFNNEYIHEYSEILANKMCLYLDKKGIEKIKMQYYLEILLLNITKLTVVFGISLILGILPQTLLTLVSFNILRCKAFGVHAKSAFSCFASSVSIFVILVYFANKILINNTIVLILFIIFSVLVYKYAPADTEKRPITGKKARKRLKKQAVFSILLLMVIALIIPFNSFKILITFGSLIEVVTILPITYIILKRRRDNYENYENVIEESSY